MALRHRTLSHCRFVFVTGAKAHNSSFITYRTAVSRTKTSNIFSRYKYDITLSERRLKNVLFFKGPAIIYELKTARHSVFSHETQFMGTNMGGGVFWNWQRRTIK